jgi:hypothetical protein
MLAVRTPGAPPTARVAAACGSAFPFGRQGRLLRSRSISGLFPVHFIPAYNLPVYASQRPLPDATQDSVRSCSLGFAAAAISDGSFQRACKAQLPHHRTYGSVYGGSRSYANAVRSKIRFVIAGRSGSLTTESDSMSSRPACRASPIGADEKSSLNWIFSRLSLSRFMSYLPLLSFGPSAIVSGSAYLLTPTFGDGVPH